MSVNRSGEARLSGEDLLQETYAVQMANVNHNEADPGGGNTRANFNGLLSEVDQPIEPARGYAWTIHRIDWSVYAAPEDDSSDNVSEHLESYFELSEEPLQDRKLSTNAEVTIGDTASDTDQGADLNSVWSRQDGPWVQVMGECVAGYHDDVNGLAGGPTHFNAQGTFQPPKPITITSRTSLDWNYSGVFPFGTSISGEETAKIGMQANVWFEQEDIDEFRR